MEKTVSKIIILLMIFCFFNGCAREEFMDLYGFTERFEYTNLTPEDFYTETDENGNNYYYTFFDKEKPKIMLKLINDKENKISEARIYLPKFDENAHKKPISTEEINLFLNLLRSTAKAFAGYGNDASDELINQMQLYEKSSYEKEGELTKTKDNFHFVYLSACLGSEFIIYNTYLVDVPETEKPESKPMYGDTTKIRTETVPTK